MHWRRKWQPTPVFLPGESQERGILVGCRLWGRTESNTTEVTQQQQQHCDLGLLLVLIYCVLVLVAQSCPTLCNLVDCNPTGSSVREILQARVLEWVAIPFSGYLSDPGIQPRSPAWQADSLPYCWESIAKFCKMSRITLIEMLGVTFGTSLEIQWLWLHLPTQGVWVQRLVRELRSHMLCGSKKKKERKKKPEAIL